MPIMHQKKHKGGIEFTILVLSLISTLVGKVSDKIYETQNKVYDEFK